MSHPVRRVAGEHEGAESGGEKSGSVAATPSKGYLFYEQRTSDSTPHNGASLVGGCRGITG